MRQDEAVLAITESLKKDPAVLSIFLKGSMGRGEHDEHSDIDLYCLVEEKEEEAFLKRRLNHLKTYRDLVFYEDIFIIAPQTIAVYDDWTHVDLFTVTEKTLQKKDYFAVLYDPEGRMEKYKASQHLTLTREEFREQVLDAVWFLFQYRKAAGRGNDLWTVEMLRHVMRGVAGTLLYRYAKDRSVLGLKTVPRSLPEEQQNRVREIYEHMTPSSHRKAASEIARLLEGEKGWIHEELEPEDQTRHFFDKVVEALLEVKQ